jgi:drug/metabolite transporter (DMT)-like permease
VTAAARPRVLGTALVCAAAACWGCWSLFLRPSGLEARESSPFALLVMGLALLPLLRSDGVRPRWDRTSVAMLLGNTACVALNVVTFFGAMQVTTVGVAVLTHYLAPLFVAVLAPWVEGRRVKGAVPAALLAIAGLALVLEPWRDARGGVAAGALLGALSAVAYAGNVFLTARLAPRIGAARAVSCQALLAALLLAPLIRPGALAEADPLRLAWLAAGAVVLGALAGVAFVRGLALVGSTTAATLAFLEPLVAVVIGWIAWGESLGWPALAGGAVVLGAGAWVSAGREVSSGPS